MRRCMMGLMVLICLLTGLVRTTPIRAQSQTPTPIHYGTPTSGQLDASHVEAYYSLDAQQGDAITVTMDVTDGTLTPFLILLDQSQANVLGVSNGPGNDSGGHAQARLAYVVPANGTYIIKTTAVQGTGIIQGKFTLLVTLDNPTPTPSPTANAPLIAPYKPDDS